MSPRRRTTNLEDLLDIPEPDSPANLDEWTHAKCAMTGCPNTSSLENLVITPVVDGRHVTFYTCSDCWTKIIEPWLLTKKTL